MQLAPYGSSSRISKRIWQESDAPMTTPTLPALSEREVHHVAHTLRLSGRFTEEMCALIAGTLLECVRRSRLPPGGTYVEIATAWIAERPAWDRSSAERDAQSLATLLASVRREACEECAKVAEEYGERARKSQQPAQFMEPLIAGCQKVAFFVRSMGEKG